MIDLAAFSQHLAEVRHHQCEPLRRAGNRFPDWERLIRDFEGAAEAVVSSASVDVRGVSSRINELCIANELLRSVPSQFVIRYELPLERTGETIDFVAINDAGDRRYFDVKTVDPTWQDGAAALQRLERSRPHVPSSIHLSVDAPNYHHMTSARAKFRDHTFGLERKISALASSELGHYKMVFCGSGFA